MTKKFLFGAMAAGMLFATSCSNEIDVIAPVGEEATVALSVDIPQLQMSSRAFSDGTTAIKLQYGIYEVTETSGAQSMKLIDALSAIGDGAENISLNKTIEKKLRTGQTYAIVFWADAGTDAPYSVNFDENGEVTMTADYSTNGATNSDNLDAFYFYQEPFKVNGDMTLSAKLSRPFAQINVGTNDLTAVTTEESIVKTKLTAHGVYSTLDLITGFVSNPVDVALTLAEKPGDDETFPVANYNDYLAMGYFLVGKTQEGEADRSLINLDFTIDIDGKADDRRVSNVPVQRNWKTNIYGQLLTSNVDVMVEIVPDFTAPDNDYVYTDLDLLADKGGELTLSSDIEIDHDIVFTKDAVINLNGHTITSKDGKKMLVGSVVSRAAADAVTLTIKGDASGRVEAPIVVDGGKLNIEGGTFVGEEVIKVGEGSADTDIVITGGTFEDFNPSKFVPEGGNVVGDGDSWFTIVPDGTEFVDKGIVYDETTGIFSVSTVEGLKWISEQVNNFGKSELVETKQYNGYSAQKAAFYNQTIELTSDIDMQGVDWTPIGFETNENSASIYGFAGTFDGKGHTISNLTVTTKNDNNAGLFGATNRATIKNLTLKDVNITSQYKTGAITGDGMCARIENCHVIGGTITVTPWQKPSGVFDDANNVGGIVGYLNGQPEEAWVKDCTVDGLTITAFRKIGGIAGVATSADDANPRTCFVTVTGNTVKNTSIIADMSEKRYDKYNDRKPEIGKIVGLASDDRSTNDKGDKYPEQYPRYKVENNTAGDDVTLKVIGKD
ncbi:MAG: hypothetical protein J1E38_00280 [Paramuribaculum sp.]|nr:hypothetical protein [Paramuribaculum sp.]